MTLTYSSYLRLPELLELQQPRSTPPEHDEMLFIVIHQVYELWFKLVLHEAEKVERDFSANDLYGAIATWKRLRTILKTLVGQLDILETMTPLSFASFRDRLDTASGFQSFQFREIEFAFGYKRPQVTGSIPEHEGQRTSAARRLEQRSVMDHFYDFLGQRGVRIPAELLAKDVTQPTQPNEALQDELLRVYHEQPELVILFELMTDFDEGFQEWRYRHIKLVERTIGAKRGTGGSPGVEFLKQSLWKPLFPDLWAIRHRM
ncbi:MAG TPA: tryptophan 2,3-dioxygenase family protein [Gemmatimonadales bacterium]|jgi:tryptophan 2,3-dioxygenase|nr:tryptophan 2,3-dioxygenase family protein [Gemmatimonadales bacterium]